MGVERGGLAISFVMLPAVWAPSPDFNEARGVIGNYVEALTTAAPPRVVVLSSMGANRTSGLGMITALSLLEQGFRRLTLPIAYVRAGGFFENFLYGLHVAQGSARPSSPRLNVNCSRARNSIRMNKPDRRCSPSSKAGTSVIHSAQPRYVVDKSRDPCLVVGIVGCARPARVRATNSATALVFSESRLKIHGPSDSGCSAALSPRSPASLSVLGLTPMSADASVRFIHPSAARRSLE